MHMRARGRPDRASSLYEHIIIIIITLRYAQHVRAAVCCPAYVHACDRARACTRCFFFFLCFGFVCERSRARVCVVFVLIIARQSSAVPAALAFALISSATRAEQCVNIGPGRRSRRCTQMRSAVARTNTPVIAGGAAQTNQSESPPCSLVRPHAVLHARACRAEP